MVCILASASILGIVFGVSSRLTLLLTFPSNDCTMSQLELICIADLSWYLHNQSCTFDPLPLVLIKYFGDEHLLFYICFVTRTAVGEGSVPISQKPTFVLTSVKCSGFVVNGIYSQLLTSSSDFVARSDW